MEREENDQADDSSTPLNKDQKPSGINGALNFSRDMLQERRARAMDYTTSTLSELNGQARHTLQEIASLVSLDPFGSTAVVTQIARNLNDNDPHLTSLKFLGAEGLELVSKECAILAEALKHNSVLTSLDLSLTRIGDKAVVPLGEALKCNTTLTNLDLCENRIGNNGCSAIAAALQLNTSLTSLRLEGNPIGDKGSDALATALLKNTSLTSLQVGGDKISVQSLRTLLDALLRNFTLGKFDIHGFPKNHEDELRREFGLRNAAFRAEIHRVIETGPLISIVLALRKGANPILPNFDGESAVLRLWKRFSASKAQVPSEAVGSEEKLKALLQQHFVGQEHLLPLVARIVGRQLGSRSLPQNPRVYFWAGPSGTGKTHLAKLIARLRFTGELAEEACFKRYEMSSYRGEQHVNSFMGSAPGYQGGDKGGILVSDLLDLLDTRWPANQLKVVLFDEFDRADSAVLNSLLSLFGEGFIVDTAGKRRRVDCRSVIFVCTSNRGQDRIAKLKLSERIRNEATRQAALLEAKEAVANALTKENKQTGEAAVAGPLVTRLMENISVFIPFSPTEITRLVETELRAFARRLIRGQLSGERTCFAWTPEVAGHILQRFTASSPGSGHVLGQLINDFEDSFASHLANRPEQPLPKYLWVVADVRDSSYEFPIVHALDRIPEDYEAILAAEPVCRDSAASSFTVYVQEEDSHDRCLISAGATANTLLAELNANLDNRLDDGGRVQYWDENLSGWVSLTEATWTDMRRSAHPRVRVVAPKFSSQIPVVNSPQQENENNNSSISTSHSLCMCHATCKIAISPDKTPNRSFVATALFAVFILLWWAQCM